MAQSKGTSFDDRLRKAEAKVEELEGLVIEIMGKMESIERVLRNVVDQLTTGQPLPGAFVKYGAKVVADFLAMDKDSHVLSPEDMAKYSRRDDVPIGQFANAVSRAGKGLGVVAISRKPRTVVLVRNA